MKCKLAFSNQHLLERVSELCRLCVYLHFINFKIFSFRNTQEKLLLAPILLKLLLQSTAFIMSLILAWLKWKSTIQSWAWTLLWLLQFRRRRLDNVQDVQDVQDLERFVSQIIFFENKNKKRNENSFFFFLWFHFRTRLVFFFKLFSFI